MLQLESFNNQEVYNKVKKHLLQQRAKSMYTMGFGGMHPTKKCAYKGDRGRKCSIGCLIPDENYIKALESKPIQNPIVQKSLPYYDLNLNAINFLASLQRIHDGVPVEQWKNTLNSFAHSQGLTP